MSCETWDTMLLVLAVVALWALLIHEFVSMPSDIDKGRDKYDH